ncbi:MAG TPA: hypothetical protein DIT40_08915 [Alphaproteobacteria bacterium]|nr:hypothetical protein [Alphaproteobacteria bacterium]
MGKKLLSALALVVLAFIAIDVMGPDVPGKPESVAVQPAEQVGYFKSPDRDRVMAYYRTDPLTRSEAESLFEEVPETAGRVTRVVIYSGADNPAPASGLTLAENLLAAMQMVSMPPHDDWDWLLMINPAGERTIKEN